MEKLYKSMFVFEIKTKNIYCIKYIDKEIFPKNKPPTLFSIEIYLNATIKSKQINTAANSSFNKIMPTIDKTAKDTIQIVNANLFDKNCNNLSSNINKSRPIIKQLKHLLYKLETGAINKQTPSIKVKKETIVPRNIFLFLTLKSLIVTSEIAMDK